MIIVVTKRLLRKRFIGLTIFPFVFLAHENLKEDKITLNHEKIHLRQQMELLWLFFFLWYLVEFIIGLLRYKNGMKAYRNISFEKEAYDQEENMTYLNERPSYGFLRYLK